jgi:hypothetical protein
MRHLSGREAPFQPSDAFDHCSPASLFTGRTMTSP